MIGRGYIRGLFTGAVIGVFAGLLITARTSEPERQSEHLNTQYQGVNERFVRGENPMR